MRRNGISSLSSLVNGFNSGYRMVTDAQRDEEDQAFRQEQRARLRQQWADEDSLKASMKDAASPTTVETGEVYQPEVDDDGNAMPANPTKGTFKAGGQRFASMSEAQTAADTYNEPSQVNARMSQVLMKAGRPNEAAQLRASDRQEKVAGLQLDDMQQAYAKRKFDDALANMTSFDDIGGFTKTKAIPSQDGKSMVFHAVGPDGGTRALPYSFSNDAKGLTEAKAMLSKSLPTEQKLSYLHRQAQDVESRDRWEKEFKLREDSEKRRSTHEERMLAAVTARNAPAAPTVPVFDEKLARDTAHDAVKAENKRRGDSNQPLLSGPEVARMVDDYVGAQRTQFNNGMVLQAAGNELSRLDPKSTEYAETYRRALKLGDAKQLTTQLAAMGFQAPTATTGGVRPSAGQSLSELASNQVGAVRGTSGGPPSMSQAVALSARPSQPVTASMTWQQTQDQAKRLRDLQSQFREVPDPPPVTVQIPAGVGASTKEAPNPEYAAWYAKFGKQHNDLVAAIQEARKN